MVGGHEEGLLTNQGCIGLSDTSRVCGGILTGAGVLRDSLICLVIGLSNLGRQRPALGG